MEPASIKKGMDGAKKVAGEMAKKLKKDNVQKNVQEAARVLRRFDFTMGGKGAITCVNSLVSIGKVMPFIGAAIGVGSFLVGLYVEGQQSPELIILEQLTTSISQLQLAVAELPEKIKELFEQERVEGAINACASCRHSLEMKKFARMDREISDVKKTCHAVARLLTNEDSKFMDNLAKKAEYKPAEFVAAVGQVFSPYVEGMRLVCALDTHLTSISKGKCTMDNIEAQCDNTKRLFMFDDVIKSITEKMKNLYILRSGEGVAICNQSLEGRWTLNGFEPTIKGYWAKCHDRREDDGPMLLSSVVKLIGIDDIPEKLEDLRPSYSELKVEDSVAIAGYYGLYLYRFPGSLFTSSNYCFYVETKSKVQREAGMLQAMHWNIESSQKVGVCHLRDGDAVHFRCDHYKAGRDAYLTCNYDGYVTTSPRKQEYQIRSLRLMSKQEQDEVMYGRFLEEVKN